MYGLAYDRFRFTGIMKITNKQVVDGVRDRMAQRAPD